MTLGDALRLFTLSAIWGASFLFIKLGVDAVSPLVVVDARLVAGGLTVLVFAFLARQRAGLLTAFRRPAPYVVGMINAAIPYFCFAWAETRITSGIAAIANATAPIYSVLLSPLWRKRGTQQDDRPTPTRLMGVLVGFAGVVVLFSSDAAHVPADIPALLLVLAAPVLYALGSRLARDSFAHDPPLVPAATTNGAAALVLLPLVLLAGHPTRGLTVTAGLAILALGCGGTGIAYIIMYRLIQTIGATRSLMSTYIVPVFALIYGRIFLGEAIRPEGVLALVLILCGVAVTSDSLPRLVLFAKHHVGFLS